MPEKKLQSAIAWTKANKGKLILIGAGFAGAIVLVTVF